MVAQPSDKLAHARASTKSRRAAAKSRAESRCAGWAANIAIVCINGVRRERQIGSVENLEGGEIYAGEGEPVNARL